MLLHLVTDPRLDRERLLAVVSAVADQGVDWIHLRDHRATARDLFDLATAIAAIAGPRRIRIAVNDRVDVALAVGANGVQLGRRSLSVEAVRRIAPGLRIGASVHDRNGALAAQAAGADWLTFGHVFETSSHPGEAPAGLEALGDVVRAVTIPVIAIGGIGLEDIAAVRQQGAAGVAVISAIVEASDPAAAASAFRRRLDGRG